MRLMRLIFSVVIIIVLASCIEGDHKMRDISSIELIQEFNNGWNLGNTLDATNPSLAGKSPEEFETAWGNPVTTPEMIDRKSTRLNSSHVAISYAVFCLKKTIIVS